MFSPKRLERYREKLMFEPPSLMKAILIDDDDYHHQFPAQQSQQSDFGVGEGEYFAKCSIGEEKELSLLGVGATVNTNHIHHHHGFISKRMAADFDNLDESRKKRLTLYCREQVSSFWEYHNASMSGGFQTSKELFSHQHHHGYQTYDTLLYTVFDPDLRNCNSEQNNFITNGGARSPSTQQHLCHHEFEIRFTNNYPLQPPRVRCHTLYHPNVHPMTSEVCLPLLTLNEWKPCFVISTILTAIDQLLTDPMHWASDWNTSRVNGEAFQLLRSNEACFQERKQEYYFSRRASPVIHHPCDSQLSSCIDAETPQAEADSSSLDEMMMDDPHV
ncbi:hypothetical protein C9374_004357 [Naegleria lovaniensis]|uniref:UBC core domain-containing protein n=1 Tax=Naegleria lovaniensis TaxID=51637 RepID=A0AA88GMF8_NAELO|nr:uncharacterized protein C9374_004357 [Naegleria lovaniensis]KAG2383686.1 hypothetical protein C9374_004357 [Naegleria lovaniensis]